MTNFRITLIVFKLNILWSWIQQVENKIEEK